MTEEQLKSMQNKESISQAQQCGCFYCLRVFPPDKIEEWVDKLGDTALCPFCGINSVLADPDEMAKQFGLREPDLLQEMHEHWFHGAGL